MTRIRRIVTDFTKPVALLFKSVPCKYYRIFLYLIIPVIFLVNATVIHYNKGKFFLTNVDPEYFFLYNGASIGAGNLSVPYTSNPGTPLMVLIAISSRIVSIFQPGNYLEDIVNDPEKYIHAANLMLVLIIASVLFFCGWYVKKISGSWIAGLLLQLSLPGSASLMMVSGMLKAEAMTILPVLLLCMAVFYYLFTKQEQEKTSDKMLVLFGLICGLGMASKLIFMPLFLIPLIILKTSFFQKIKLFLYTVLSFAVFAYPVVFNNGDFWGWIGGIVSHTGKYGEGQKGFIDFASIPVNLDRLYDNDRAFFFITGLSLVIGIILSIRYFNNKISHLSANLSRTILAVSVGIIACIALDLKHFEVHYFFPVYVLKFFMISLIYILVTRLEIINKSGIIRVIAILVLCSGAVYAAYVEMVYIQSSNRYLAAKRAQLDEEYRKVISLVEPGSPVIISGRYYGTPFIEFAHYEGFKMSRKVAGSFIPYLKQKYPVTYQYVSWADKFYYWDRYSDFKTILGQTTKSFYIFIGEKKAEDLPVIEERIWQVLDSNAVNREKVYENPTNGDQLIRMTPLAMNNQ